MEFMNMFCKEEDHTLDRVFGAVAGIGVGVGLMYLLDPSMGRRRRSMIMEGVSSATHKAGEGIETAWHKTTESVSGAAEKVAEGARSVAEKAKSMISGGDSDRADNRRMPGTDEEPWPPTTRMLVGTAGGALVAFGMTQRFPVACALGTVGLGLVAPAVTNFEIEDYLRMGGGHDESSEVIRPEQSRIQPPHMGRPPAMGAAGERPSRPTHESRPASTPHRANSK